MTYCGIDNGVSGALAVLTPTDVQMFPIPTTVSYESTVVDVVRLHDILLRLSNDYGPLRIACEIAGKFTPGKLALISVWDSWATIRSVMNLLHLRYTAFAPRTWQREMLRKGYTDTKQASLEAARRLFPDVSLRRTDRSRTDDHNLSDALLIAEYGRRHNI